MKLLLVIIPLHFIYCHPRIRSCDLCVSTGDGLQNGIMDKHKLILYVWIE